MNRRYKEENIGIESLVGRKILSAKINSEKDAMLLETDEGNFFLNWEGDCCAHCYIAHINGANLLVGSTVLSAENTEWSDLSRNEEDYDVVETMGTKLKTTNGYVDIETRVSHNGYYGGMVNVNREGYIDAYNCFVEIEGVNKPVEDF